MLHQHNTVQFDTGNVQTVLFNGDERLAPVIRTKDENFTDTALRASNKLGLDAVINGEQCAVSNKAYFTLMAGKGADPGLTDTIGEVISNGKIVAGRSSSQTFYVAQFVDKAGDVQDRFGFGNPPLNLTAAFGGGVPLIIDGLKYGSTNLYAGNAAGAPLTGDPGAFAATLTQRSNSGFAVYEQKYEQGGNYSTGKVIVAYSNSADALAFVVQPDGAKQGMSIAAIRDRLYNAGFNNAIAFDGSSSATLVRNSTIQVQPIFYKNGAINVGIGARNGKH